MFVLDTSVILSDTRALERLSDQHIVLPLAVLTELEAKRNHPDLGYPARSALRYLEGFRNEYSLTEPIQTSAGGSIRVEMNHISTSDLPENFRTPDNDNRILAVAANLASDGVDVTLLTKDLPLRLMASVVGVKASDYDYEANVDADWLGMQTIKVDGYVVDNFYEEDRVWLDETIVMPVNTGIILKSNQQSALGRIGRDGYIQKLASRLPMGIEPRNAEQAIALDLLCDSNVGIVSIGGLAGSGKTIMALAAGVSAVKDKGSPIQKVIVFRPVSAVGSQDLGFLPGTADEKMAPWAVAVDDALESFMKINEIRDLGPALKVLPLSHIRGRTLKNTFVIIDEAQNLDLMTLVTALSRLGEGSRVVLTHDVTQRDNLRVGKYDGVARIVSTLSGSDLFAHVTMRKSERSAIAELVAGSFDL